MYMYERNHEPAAHEAGGPWQENAGPGLGRDTGTFLLQADAELRLHHQRRD